MKNTRFIQTLSLLNNKEYSAFQKFRKHQTGNPKETICKLVDILYKYHPQLELKPPELYSKLYKNEYDATKLNRLFHRSLKILQEFICFRKIQKKHFTSKQLLSSFAHERNSATLFDRHCNQWEEETKSLDWGKETLEKYQISNARKEFATQQSAMNPLNIRFKKDKASKLNAQLRAFERMVIHHSYSLKSQGSTINGLMLKNLEIRDDYLNHLIDHHEENNITPESYPGYEFMIEEAKRSYQIMRHNSSNDHAILIQKIKYDSQEIPLKDQRRILYYLMVKLYNQSTKLYQVMIHYDLQSDELDKVMNKYRVSVSRNDKWHSERLAKGRIFINCLYQLLNSLRETKAKS